MKRATARRSALSLAASLLAVLLASCGGGGGAASPAAAPAQPGGSGAAQATQAITGYVVEGPVAGSSVKLYQVDRAGKKTLLGSAITGADGYFSIPNTAPANAVILVEAAGGTYIDDMSRQQLTLALPLRAAAVSNGGAARISVTPFSEVQVRMLERLQAPDWSAEMLAKAGSLVSALIDVPDFLDFVPVDLQSAAPAAAARPRDVTLSFFTAGFGAYARRIDPNPATSLNNALEGLRYLISVDQHDDFLLPAFIGGVADFMNVSAVPEAVKQPIKTVLLTVDSAVPPTPLGDEVLARYMPTGVSSGGATAAMVDNSLQLVGIRTPGSVFNRRGALVGYPLDSTNGLWRMTYTASVAEVYGDGDVGIGRWNGGTTMDGTRSGAALTATIAAQPLSYGSWHYAAARPVTLVPACGTRRLSLVASTQPTVMSDAQGASVAGVGLTPDSSVTFQFADRILAGFDIGVRAADGSVTRFTSTGGLEAPWASRFSIDPAKPLVEGSTTLAPDGGSAFPWGIGVRGLASGSGATKLALKLTMGPTFGPTELAAVFAAPAGAADSSGCASPSASPGVAIDPAPANGAYHVLSGIDNTVSSSAPAVDAVFRGRGELAATPTLQVGAGTPIYELAGSADASIGRIDGDFTLNGIAYHRSLPYAVARAGAVLPATGARHYVLVGSTLLAAEVAPTSTSGLVQGRVQSASLDVNFGEYPVGAGNPYYGSASFHVSGSMGNIPFAIGSWSDLALPDDSGLDRSSASFGGPRYQGVLSAPGGEYAVVWIRASADAIPVIGTLLFRAQ